MIFRTSFEEKSEKNQLSKACRIQGPAVVGHDELQQLDEIPGKAAVRKDDSTPILTIL